MPIRTNPTPIKVQGTGRIRDISHLHRRKPRDGEEACRLHPSTTRAVGCWGPSLLLARSPCSTCPHYFPKLVFCFPGPRAALVPTWSPLRGLPAPLPLAAGGGAGVRSCKAQSRPPHRVASIGSAEGLGVEPCSDWPVPPVRPALAMVTTLGPPGEFHIPPPPARRPSRPSRHSTGAPSPTVPPGDPASAGAGAGWGTPRGV